MHDSFLKTYIKSLVEEREQWGSKYKNMMTEALLGIKSILPGIKTDEEVYWFWQG